MTKDFGPLMIVMIPLYLKVNVPLYLKVIVKMDGMGVNRDHLFPSLMP